jgi:hypothetical protein
MTDNGVRWDPMAKSQRDNLPARNRRQLEKALASLEGLPPERWPRKKAFPLRGEPPLYLLILPEGFRAFIAPAQNNGVEVQSLTHEEQLRFFRERVEEQGSHG